MRGTGAARHAATATAGRRSARWRQPAVICRAGTAQTAGNAAPPANAATTHAATVPTVCSVICRHLCHRPCRMPAAPHLPCPLPTPRPADAAAGTAGATQAAVHQRRRGCRGGATCRLAPQAGRAAVASSARLLLIRILIPLLFCATVCPQRRAASPASWSVVFHNGVPRPRYGAKHSVGREVWWQAMAEQRVQAVRLRRRRGSCGCGSGSGG